MLLIELNSVSNMGTNRDVLLLATLRYVKAEVPCHQAYLLIIRLDSAILLTILCDTAMASRMEKQHH